MLIRFVAFALALTITTFVGAVEPAVAKVTALASGQLLLNGKPSDIRTIDKAFAELKARGGVVWYYRENPQREPHPNAMAAIELVVKHQLPISMSSKPDFSDYVDPDGRSKPRRP